MKHFHYYGYKTTGKKAKKVAITGIVQDDILFIGVAHCSNDDQFVKKTGRELSTGKAMLNPITTIQVYNPDRCINTFFEFCKKTTKKPLRTGKRSYTICVNTK